MFTRAITILISLGLLALCQAYPNNYRSRFGSRRVGAGSDGFADGESSLFGSNSRVQAGSNGRYDAFSESGGVAGSRGPSEVGFGAWAGSDTDRGTANGNIFASGNAASASAGHSSVTDNELRRAIAAVGSSAAVSIDGHTVVGSSGGLRNGGSALNVGSNGSGRGGVAVGSSVLAAGSFLDKRTGHSDSWGTSRSQGTALN